MKNKITYYVVDAFTSQPFMGNPAGVVIDSGLNTEQMQLIAKEMNLSETAFICEPENDKSDFRVRYFTPTSEIDFCGHATVGLSWVVFLNKMISNTTLKIETNIGIIPVEVSYENNVLKSVTMTQVEPKVRDLKYNLNELSEMIGISESDFDLKYPIKLAYTGNWNLLVGIKSKDAIDKAKPDFGKLCEHNKKYNLACTHLFTFDIKDALLYTRDFAPSVGVNEDPVTGSANGALAGYLAIENITNLSDYIIIQGNSLNRLGELNVHIENNDGHIKVQVGGSAVIIFEGKINI